MENWIPISEYAKKNGISVSTVRRRIKENKIPFKKEGARYLVKDEEKGDKLAIIEEALLNMIESQKELIKDKDAKIEELERIIKFKDEEIDELKMLISVLEEATK